MRVSAEIIGFISDGIGQIVILPIVSVLACAHRIFIGRLQTRGDNKHSILSFATMLRAAPILWTTKGANNTFFLSLELTFDPCAVCRFAYLALEMRTTFAQLGCAARKITVNSFVDKHVAIGL